MAEVRRGDVLVQVRATGITSSLITLGLTIRLHVSSTISCQLRLAQIDQVIHNNGSKR